MVLSFHGLNPTPWATKNMSRLTNALLLFSTFRLIFFLLSFKRLLIIKRVPYNCHSWLHHAGPYKSRRCYELAFIFFEKKVSSKDNLGTVAKFFCDETNQEYRSRLLEMKMCFFIVSDINMQQGGVL